MIIITLGDTSRRLSSPSAIDESWIMLHLRSAAAGDPPGVHVRIDAPTLSLNLSAGEKCVVPPGRPLVEGEMVVLELWRERGLDRPDFRRGQLVAFLHQLYDLLEPAREPGQRSRSGAPQCRGRSHLHALTFHPNAPGAETRPGRDESPSVAYI